MEEPAAFLNRVELAVLSIQNSVLPLSSVITQLLCSEGALRELVADLAKIFN